MENNDMIIPENNNIAENGEMQQPEAASVTPAQKQTLPTQENVPQQTGAEPAAPVQQQTAPVQESIPQPKELCYTASAPEIKKLSKRPKKIWKRLLSAVLVLVLIAGSCGVTALVLNEMWEDRFEDRLEDMEDSHREKLDDLEEKIRAAYRSNANTNNNTGESVSGSPAATVDGLTPAQVYARNVNAVVMISAEVSASSMFGQTTGISTGTGFVISSNGYVVTNCHVVEGATKLSVETTMGDKYDAVLVGSDAPNDVAVLKIEAQDLQTVTIGSSTDLIVGDQVVAIGNPLGELTSTLTVGYVSAKERNVNTDGTAINMLQTDAAINSGNSGGPLFNMKGEVVGITTAKYSGTSNSGATIEGIGFAIPIDDVYDMIDDLVNYGYVTGAYLGISVSDTDPDAAAYFDMPVGAYVHEVVPGYCADKAGLMAKDVIVKLGDYNVAGLNDLSRALRSLEPGETTTIVVVRTGQRLELTITLDEKPLDQQQ